MSSKKLNNGQRSKPRSIDKPLVIEEVNALIRYASERAVDPEGKIIPSLRDAIQEYNEIKKREPDIQKVGKDKADAVSEEDADNQASVTAASKVLSLYAKLILLMPANRLGESNPDEIINGRTLLDTEQHYHSQAGKVLAWGLLFLFLAFSTEALNIWFNNISKTPDGGILTLMKFHKYFLKSFSPFFWGALGSCVFLMKRLSDRAGRRTFDRSRWKGWSTRILIGGVLGTVVVYLFDPNILTSNSQSAKTFNLTANATAFLVGVGVRVFYGGIEKIIDVVAQRFNIGVSGDKKPDAEIIKDYLTQQLELADDPATQKSLKELILQIPA